MMRSTDGCRRVRCAEQATKRHFHRSSSKLLSRLTTLLAGHRSRCDSRTKALLGSFDRISVKEDKAGRSIDQRSTALLESWSIDSGRCCAPRGRSKERTFVTRQSSSRPLRSYVRRVRTAPIERSRRDPSIDELFVGRDPSSKSKQRRGKATRKRRAAVCRSRGEERFGAPAAMPVVLGTVDARLRVSPAARGSTLARLLRCQSSGGARAR